MPSMIHVAKEWERRRPFTPPNIRAVRQRERLSKNPRPIYTSVRVADDRSDRGLVIPRYPSSRLLAIVGFDPRGGWNANAAR